MNTTIAGTILLQLQKEPAVGAPFGIDAWLQLVSVSKSGRLIFRDHTYSGGDFTMSIEMFRIRDVITPIMEFVSNEISTPPNAFG